MFRTAGGPDIGLGHLLRCLALAEAFARRGLECSFAGAVPAFLARRFDRFAVLPVPGGMADWADPGFAAAVDGARLLVTDLYAIGRDWQSRSPAPVLAITDPPVGDLAWDLLLMPTAFALPPGVRAMTAPEHALIGAPIRALRTSPRSGRRILVSAGGGQDRGLTVRILAALASAPALRGLNITVVAGDLPDAALDRIREACGLLPRARIHERVSDMAALVAAHDIALGTPAGSALERCALGLAQVLVPIAPNQHLLGRALAARRVATVLGEEASARDIANALERLLDDRGGREAMAARAFALIDGLGAERVADACLAGDP